MNALNVHMSIRRGQIDWVSMQMMQQLEWMKHAGPMLPQIQGQGGPPMGGDDAEMVDILEHAGNSKAKVWMVVLDGIVDGPQCEFFNVYILDIFFLIFYLVLFLS